LKTLIFGFGNIDRQDDGVAWHVMLAVMQKLGIDTALMDENVMPFTYGEYEFQFQLQLMPEFAEDLGQFDRAVFIDAHTGNIPEAVHQEAVLPAYQNSPFTHHMTAATLLSLCQVINGKVPDAILVSVRGYEFEFTRELSERTRLLADKASQRIIDWIVPKQDSGG
jgi:hydrogenase maturation protease